MATTSTTTTLTARSFKGGGSVISQRIETVPSVDSPPIGIKTPLRKATKRGQLFDQHLDIESDIIDNFKNMILTNYGERLMYPEFGANLNMLLTERVSQDDWDEKASRTIINTTQKYMPQVSVNNVVCTPHAPKNDGLSRIIVTVTYSIQRLGIQARKLDITLTSMS